MAISRMQEPRQLYGLGSLVRKITRPIKKAVKGVKKVANSPIGRLALLYAGGAALGGSTALGGAGGSFFSRLANPGNLANLSNVFGNKALGLKGISGVGGEGIARFLNPFNKANPLFFKEGAFNIGRAGLTASALGAALPFLAPGLLAPEQIEEEEIDIVNTPESIAALNQRARDFYNYGDENLMFMPKKQYVMRNFYAAKGGLADEEDEEFDRNLTGILRTRKQKGGSVPESKVKGYDTPAGFNKFDYPTGGVQVRTPKKQGGLMNLGGLEMDFRAEGGFVPIGAKEKAADVPARLSKNEFVMTADAVRGAGNGSIKAGAQKMYNTMKELENRVV